MRLTFRAVRMAAITVALGFGMLEAQERGASPTKEYDATGNSLDPAERERTGKAVDKKMVDPEKAPKWNPGFGDQIPNRSQSGNTPRENSTLQNDRKDFRSEYFGWLGLLGLAGLFGLRRGADSSSSPIDLQARHDPTK